MLYLTAALTLVWAALIGIKEGMVMIQTRDARIKWITYISNTNGNDHAMVEGIRCHVWFKYYHMKFVQTIFRGLPILIGYLLSRLDWQFFTLFFLAGTLGLCWQLLESFYSWTRYATWLPESENFMGRWRVYNVPRVIVIRIGISALLMLSSFIL